MVPKQVGAQVGSQYSLCEGKEKAKTVYKSLFSMSYRNLKQNAAAYIVGSNRQTNVGYGRLHHRKAGREHKLE
jgi:hypothetical protein